YNAIENEFFPPLGHFKVDPDTIFDYCNVGADIPAPDSCYQFLGSALQTVYPGTVKSTLALTLKHVPEPYLKSALSVIVRTLALGTRPMEEGFVSCEALRKDLADECVNVYALGLFRRAPRGIGLTRAYDFCSFTKADQQKDCFATVQS